MCILGLDESQLIVALGHNATAGAIDLMACLDSIDPSPARYALALTANFDPARSGNVILAADPGTGALVVKRRCHDADLAAGGLAKAVDDFVTVVEGWRQRLGEIDMAEQPATEATAPTMGIRA